MKVTSFAYQIDNEDRIGFSSEAVVENKTQYEISMIKTNSLIVNSEGVCIGGDYNNEHEVFIDPSESISIDLRSGWGYPIQYFGDELDKIKSVNDAVFYRRDFMKLGEFEVPREEHETRMIKKDVTVGGMIDIMGVAAIRGKTEENGEVRVEINCALRNISDTHIEKAVFRAILNDREDAQVDMSQQYDTLPPHTGKCFRPSFYQNKGKLRDATIRLSVAIYLPVDHISAEAVATKFERD